MCKLCIKSLAELLGFVIQEVYVAKDSYRYECNTPTLIFENLKPVDLNQKLTFNPKNCGGGRILPGAQEIACHFSQDHTMVTKFLDFIKKHPKYKVVKSFFYYLDRCSRNSAETEPRS